MDTLLFIFSTPILKTKELIHAGKGSRKKNILFLIAGP